MNDAGRMKGISGLTGLFRESMAGVPDGSIVVFTGSVGVCTPFAELLAYSVRGRGFQLIYVPNADISQARPMLWADGIGFVVSDERVEPSHADILVVMGGLAMPRSGQPVDVVEALYKQLGNPRLIGVGFMDVFKRSGWVDRLPFDALVDGYMDAGMWSKGQ